MPTNSHNPNSIETILTFENRDAQSDWSVVWSTAHIPGMDNATGGGPRRVLGRRRLRLGALTLGFFLTMHCRVTASVLTGGFFVFIVFLVLAVAALANPLRHFEVYLGQWSISGPGRAFRIIPMLDGIGIAICLNSIIRAIHCCAIAAIAALYLLHAVSDAKLPYTYCRDFELNKYEPILKDVNAVMFRESRFSLATGVIDDETDKKNTKTDFTTVGTRQRGWRNMSMRSKAEPFIDKLKLQMCNEKYSGSYPPLFSTPAYNFFYVEVVHLRSDYSFLQFNTVLLLSVIFVWSLIWLFLIVERISHGRLIWNNIHTWFMVVPWIWTISLLLTATMHVVSRTRVLSKVFKIGTKEVLSGVCDALEVALYINSASTGSEILHGKGLNHYASGHIDPYLNGENILHSVLLLLLTALHSGAAAICAIVDQIQPNNKYASYDFHESTLWIIPMYSKCALVSNYSHLTSALIFGGMTFSYLAVAYIFLKTALHTIFEYKVKLVFIEQVVVGGLILSCMGLSLLFATNGGIPLLESIDSLMVGIAMPFICLMQLIGLLYVYRSHDFLSDMQVATEENACSTRISTQWQIIPFVTASTLIMKLLVLSQAEMPAESMYMAMAPLLGVVLAIPLRACHNVYVFLKPAPRHGT